MSLVDHDRIIKDFFTSVSARRYDEVETFLADDVQWWFPQSAVDRGQLPSRCADGRQNVLDYIGRAPKNYRRNQLTVLRFIDDGDSSAAHVRGEGETHAGKEHSHEYVFMFKFRDEKIVEVREFVDTAYIYARFNW